MSKAAKSRTRTRVCKQSSVQITTTISELEPARETSSKQGLVLSMLSGDRGVTIPEIMQQTNWKHHSVRAFLTTVVRQKLKQELISEKIDGKRIYRIEG